MENLNIRFDVPGLPQVIIASAREFKTGSKGYYASGKIALPNGLRAQVSCNIVVIGSKKAADASKGGKALTVAMRRSAFLSPSFRTAPRPRPIPSSWPQ